MSLARTHRPPCVPPKVLAAAALALSRSRCDGGGGRREHPPPVLRPLHRQRDVAPAARARHRRMELVPDRREGRQVRLRQIDRAAQSVPPAAQLPRRPASSERTQSGPARLLRHVAHAALRSITPSPGPTTRSGIDQVVAQHTKQHCRQPSLVLSIDAGTGFLSRTGTISYSLEGRPIPAENSPPRVFDRLFRERPLVDPVTSGTPSSKRIKLVDAVAESARDFNRQLGRSDRERMEQYLTSLNEVESRLIASEKWIDVPLKTQDCSHVDLDVTNESEPALYYRNMFDLIALAFDADITRSVTFMLNREDGMGISDTFPIKLGLSQTHHSLSHAGDKDEAARFREVRPVPQRADRRVPRPPERVPRPGRDGPRQHGRPLRERREHDAQSRNLPTLVAGGSRMGLRHGQFWKGTTRGCRTCISASCVRSISRPSRSPTAPGTLDGAIFRA